MNQYFNIWNQQPGPPPPTQDQEHTATSATAGFHPLQPSSSFPGQFSSGVSQHAQQVQQPALSPPQQHLSPEALISRLEGLQQNNYQPSYNTTASHNYSFHLPAELQGGVSSINSRRPSFAAEQSYTHTQSSLLPKQNQQQIQQQMSLEMFAHSTNYQQHNALMNFQSRRPSVQITSSYTTEASNNGYDQFYGRDPMMVKQQQQQQHNGNSSGGVLELENGLLLQGNVIVTSPDLQGAFMRTKNYFCADSARELYDHLCRQCQQDITLQKVVLNLKKLNNMFSLIKPLVLVLTKSGKYEILSTPMNSNIQLKGNDVVIVDGDRGKDLVYILDPSITLDVAILINYLKKRQHSKSISYGGTHHNGSSNSVISNTVEDLVRGQGILDEETQFQIPTKQVLRFATFQEVGNLQFKLVEEIKSFKTSLLKISNQPMLNGNLTILNSEYQFDQKKLTFFYHSHQRLDFRNLIKELFKIYKTRIWLCAVPKPTPGPLSNLELTNEVHSLEDCRVDDFHVRNFAGTLQELLNDLRT